MTIGIATGWKNAERQSRAECQFAIGAGSSTKCLKDLLNICVLSAEFIVISAIQDGLLSNEAGNLTRSSRASQRKVAG